MGKRYLAAAYEGEGIWHIGDKTSGEGGIGEYCKRKY